MEQQEVFLKERVLVTGATGAIGSHLVRRLAEQGKTVRILSRCHPRGKLFPFPVEWVTGNITDWRVIHQAVRDVDTVFHLAARLHDHTPGDALTDTCEQVNVTGTRILTDAAGAADVRRLVYFSTVHVYGSGNRQTPADEQDIPRPDTLYARTKLKAEKVVLSGRNSAVVLRLAAVYGPGMKGNYARLLRALKHRWFFSVGSGRYQQALIYVEDVCQAALLAAEHPAATGQVFNVTDGACRTNNEITAAICFALKRPVPRYHLPESPVRCLLNIWQTMERLVPCERSFNSAAVEKWITNHPVDGTKIQQMLGFRPRYDLMSGWQECVNQMAHQTLSEDQ